MIKAFAAKGIIRTTLLAASYALSFFTIEAISLDALRTGPPSTLGKREQEALGYTELVALLDDEADTWHYRTPPHWRPTDKYRNLREAFRMGV